MNSVKISKSMMQDKEWVGGEPQTNPAVTLGHGHVKTV